jgi:hypothetical protein
MQVHVLRLAALLVGNNAIHMVSPPPHNFGCLTLTMHYRREFNAIKMVIPLFICMKGEQQTVYILILYEVKVNQVPKCIEGC